MESACNEKIDLLMWTKNGSKTLPRVLKRIEEVIPQKVINNKILVDDRSIDDTVEIAENFGWQVYQNKLGFVVGGVIEAFSHVKAPLFITFEQDLLLARNWFKKIPKHMQDPKVICAQGISKYTNPTLRALNEYTIEKRRWKYGLDNNIWRTELVKKVGVPVEEPIYVDTVFYDRVLRTDFKWVVDYGVVSDHIKLRTLDHIKKLYTHNISTSHFHQEHYCRKSTMLAYVVKSPFSGLKIALKKNCPTLTLIYPLIRLNLLRASLIPKRHYTPRPENMFESGGLKCFVA